MRKIVELLRMHFDFEMSNRKIAQSMSISPSTVFDILARFRAAGIQWPLDEHTTNAALESKLYAKPSISEQEKMAPVDCETIHKELRRKGVTLQLLWQEYKLANPDNGYQYSQFCLQYRRYRKELDVVMRQNHKAGEKLFVDFSGDGIDIINPKTGEGKQAELFVAVLGASNYTFCEACEAQDLPSWIQCHIHAFEYFEGVSQLLIPDNTRTAVTNPCHYDPDLNRTYLSMARHYHTAVIPTRTRKPKDKAKVENAVLIAQRWILAALRNHKFFSIEEANQAIAEKLEQLNTKKLQKLDTNRRELFELLDKPALAPLPSKRFEFAQWYSPRVNIDYHVEVEKHYYSVPYQLVHKKLEARLTDSTVELFFKGERVASHKRSFLKGQPTTLEEHMPASHREYVAWTPARILQWAAKMGPMTARLAQKIMESKAHPQQGFRACLGVMRLERAYGNKRLEAACERALIIGSPSYKSVKSILKSKLDRESIPVEKSSLPVQHDNIRGPEYYQ